MRSFRKSAVAERLRAGVDVLRAVAGEARRDRVTGLAAEIAFFGVLGLFPALLATAAALGQLEAVLGRDVATRAQTEVLGFLDRVLTDEAAGAIDTARDLFERESGGLLTAGLLGALLAMSRAFAAVIRALDDAYGVEDRRSFVRLRLTAVFLAAGSVASGAVLLGMMVLGPLFGRGADIADAVGLGDAFAAAWDAVRLPFAFTVLVVWAAVLLHVGPAEEQGWRQAVPGALLAASSWVVTSVGFRLYLTVATGGNEMLGILGGALVVLLWLYVLGLGLLLGGELNAVLSARRKPAPGPAR